MEAENAEIKEEEEESPDEYSLSIKMEAENAEETIIHDDNIY